MDQKEALGLGIIVRVIFLMIAVASGTFREGRFGAVVVVVIKGAGVLLLLGSSGFFWRSFWCSSGVLLVFDNTEEHQKNTRRTKNPEEHQKNTRRTPEGWGVFPGQRSIKPRVCDMLSQK